jgi:hypothetical protein
MGRRKQPRIEIVITRHSGLIEVVAQAEVVTSGVLNLLLDTLGKELTDAEGHFILALLEIAAPRADISLIEAHEIWRRASAMGIHRSQIAYVVTGRPIGPVARFMETVARNRGILLQFFDNRECALAWLLPESAAHSEQA